MDRHFLEGVVDSYLITHEAYKNTRSNVNKVRTVILQDLIEQINDLRINDISTYDSLYDRTKIFQHKVLNTYLTMQYSEDEENINEIVGLISLGVLGVIAAGLLGTSAIPKAIMKSLELTGKVFEWVGNSIIKRGRYWKFRYAIIQQNAKQCYIKCGLNLDEKGKPTESMNILYYLNVGSEGFPISNKKIDDISNCLSLCYLITQVEVIALLFKYYFICLKSNNNFDKIANIQSDDLLKVSSGIELSGTCRDVFEEATKAVNSYYDLLDFVFDKDDRNKNNYIKILNEKLMAVKEEIRRTSNFNKFGGKPR